MGVCGGIAVDEVVAAREKQLEPNDRVLRQAQEMQRVIDNVDLATVVLAVSYSIKVVNKVSSVAT